MIGPVSEFRDPYTGKLLVAGPDLGDPNFARTVVLILEHDAEGAVGVVINRPSDTRVADILEEWSELSCAPGVVFVGGPVQPEAAVCLAVPRSGVDDVPGVQPLVPGVASLDLAQDPALVAPGVEHLRLFAGYAGWGPGQLEGEADHDDWIVVDALPGDPFDSDPGTLWQRVLRRQGGDYRLVAHYPVDPSSN